MDAENPRPSRIRPEINLRPSRTRVDGEFLLDFLCEVGKQHLAEIARPVGDIVPFRRDRLWLPGVDQVAVEAS